MRTRRSLLKPTFEEIPPGPWRLVRPEQRNAARAYPELNAMMRAHGKAAHFPDADKSLRLFMMMESLRTGGSERQFALMAEAFRRGPFDLHLGCIQRSGKFLEDLGEIQEFHLAAAF